MEGVGDQDKMENSVALGNRTMEKGGGEEGGQTKIPVGLRFSTMSPMASRQSLLPILILLCSSGEVE